MLLNNSSFSLKRCNVASFLFFSWQSYDLFMLILSHVNSDRDMIYLCWHFNKILLCESKIMSTSASHQIFSMAINFTHEDIKVQGQKKKKKKGKNLVTEWRLELWFQILNIPFQYIVTAPSLVKWSISVRISFFLPCSLSPQYSGSKSSTPLFFFST